MDENQAAQFEAPAPEPMIPEPAAQQIPVQEPVYQQAPVYQPPYYPQQPVYQQPPVQQPYYPQQPVYQQPYYPQQPMYQPPYYPPAPVPPAAPYPQPYSQNEQEPNWAECESSSFKKALTSVITCLFPAGSILSIVMGSRARAIASRAISYAKRHNIPLPSKIKTSYRMAKAGMVTGIVFTAIYIFILMIIYNILMILDNM